MSRVRLRQDLFLGKPELVRLTNTFQGIGAANNIFEQIIEDFGVVRKDADVDFDALRVIEGSSPDRITLKAGTAIDSNIDYINVVTDQVDISTIPTDSSTYYVILSYTQTSLEAGTVSIATDGTVTGVGTAFTDLLRGLPDFPVKLRFPNAVSNTDEYLVSNVVNDTTCILNGTGFVAENDLEFEVLGTFTPGVSIPDNEKNIYLLDSWQIAVSASDTITDGLEFILAEVVTDGVTMTITDRRADFLLTLINEEEITVYDASLAATELVGFEFERYDNGLAANDRGQVQVGWGLRPSAYTADPGANTITITAGTGGQYKDLTMFADDDFNGWRCYFDNGQYQIVIDSVESGGNIILHFANYDTNIYPTVGDITVVPDADDIEFKITNAFNPNGDQITPTFGIAQGYGLIFPIVGSASNVKFRLKTRGIFSEWVNVGAGDYYAASQYDQAGFQTGFVFTASSGGNITPSLDSDNNFYQKKAWINRTNTFTKTQTFDKGAVIDNTGGLLDISAEDGNTYEVDLVQYDVDYMTSQPVGTMVTLHFDPNISYEQVRFQPVNSPPGGYLEFHFEYRSFGLGYLEIELSSNEGFVQCQVQTINGTNKWVILSNANTVNMREELAEIETDIAANASDIATLESTVNDDWTVLGAGDLGAGAGGLGSITASGAYKVMGKTVIMRFSVIGTITGTPLEVQIDYPSGANTPVTDSLCHGIIVETGGDDAIFVNNNIAPNIGLRRVDGANFAAGGVNFKGTIIWELD